MDRLINDLPGNELPSDRPNGIDRRSLLRGAGAGLAGLSGLSVLLAGCGGDSDNDNGGGGGGGSSTDAAVLNFALNLEYLEAEYYLRGVVGRGLRDADIGAGAGAVTGGRKVTFNTIIIQQFFEELTADEETHVQFLRRSLGGAAVSRPAIDLENSFNALAQAAGLGNSFDPFANEVNFAIGAFVFEDVGVTAYTGAASLLTNKSFLTAAAGILGVEAYHAGILRYILTGIGGQAVAAANAISDTRDSLAGSEKDQPVEFGGRPNFIPADQDSKAFPRTTDEVLRIVYGNPQKQPGTFFPNGVNGSIR